MKITKEMLERSNDTRLLAPCVICGGNLVAAQRQPDGSLNYYPGHEPQNACGHTITETAEVLTHIKNLSKESWQKIMKGNGNGNEDSGFVRMRQVW